jgi:hypothetical protein
MVAPLRRRALPFLLAGISDQRTTRVSGAGRQSKKFALQVGQDRHAGTDSPS